MPNTISTAFLNHSCHELEVQDPHAPLDVLTFTRSEGNCEPFTCTLEFTSMVQDIAMEAILCAKSRFQPVCAVQAAVLRHLQDLIGWGQYYRDPSPATQAWIKEHGIPYGNW
ncbi:hypothetical protein ACIPL1_16200 [Pseudomonas sp. NPDC090202]|uniref:hypothetical protein n=1 Tax=unclassified Pseudomonas TaxID=196821 RepID=UPI0037FF4DDE